MYRNLNDSENKGINTKFSNTQDFKNFKYPNATKEQVVENKIFYGNSGQGVGQLKLDIQGYFVNDNGNISFIPLQQYSSSSMSVSDLYISETNQNEPIYQGSENGKITNFYRCFNVDQPNNKWSGFKAVFDINKNCYYYQESSSSDLTYSSIKPIVGFTYSQDCLIKANLQQQAKSGDILVSANSVFVSEIYSGIYRLIDESATGFDRIWKHINYNVYILGQSDGGEYMEWFVIFYDGSIQNIVRPYYQYMNEHSLQLYGYENPIGNAWVYVAFYTSMSPITTTFIN